MRCSVARGVRLLVCGATALFLLSAPALSQETADRLDAPDWGDYPLLMSQFGELCTMCVAYVHCHADQQDRPSDEAQVLYYFQTKDFWGQIQTIWDYYAQWFNPVTAESRPATVYAGAAPRSVEAFLDKKNGIIRIDGTWIDRDNSAWFSDGSDEQIGSCSRPSIQAGMVLAEQMSQADVTPEAGAP